MSKAEEKRKRRQSRLARLGDYLDERLSLDFSRRYEAPELEGRPREFVWYRIPIEEGVSGDGSEYHIYYKKGSNKNLCLFFSGGGMAWNTYSAARPTTGGKLAAGMPNFYWNNLRPLTEFHNIHEGMMQIGNLDNPLHDWNIAIITYSTGDMHMGDGTLAYTAEDGSEKTLYFHGYRNVRAALSRIRKLHKKPHHLLLAGDSAGAFAVPAWTTTILDEYFPHCKHATLLSDSAQLLYRRWRSTVRSVWKADERFWEPIHTSNVYLDWLRKVHETWGDSLQYLYAGSPQDQLLSAYYNDMRVGEFESTREVQAHFKKQMRQMIAAMKEITPECGVFVYPFRAPFRRNGTAHTAVRHPWFYSRTPDGPSMAEWLADALEGETYDANLHLLTEMKGKKKRD